MGGGPGDPPLIPWDTDGSPPPAAPPPTPVPVPPPPGAPPAPIPGPAGLVSPIDLIKMDSEVHAPIPDTGMGAVHGNAGVTRHMDAPHDSINSFDAGHAAVQNVDENFAGNHGHTFDTHAKAVNAAKRQFETFLNALNQPQSSGSPWQGKTAQDVKKHAHKSLEHLNQFLNAANRMPSLLNTFSNDLGTAKQFFTGPNWTTYQNAMTSGPAAAREDIQNIYGHLAQQFITTRYRPPIDDIAGQHPDVTGILPPTVNTPAAGTPPVGSSGGAGGGGGMQPGGLGSPAVSAAGAGNAAPSAPPAGPSPGGAANAAGDAAQKAAGAAQNGAGQAGNAAQQAASKALDAAKNAGNRPPEGVLNLGPKGAHGAAKSGGGARGGGAGAHPSVARPADAKMAPPSKAPSTAAPVSRAGVSNAGSAGTGAPAAGQRRDEAAKVHKASKALHIQKNGEEVIGESEDAILPVLGDNPTKSPPPKPNRI